MSLLSPTCWSPRPNSYRSLMLGGLIRETVEMQKPCGAGGHVPRRWSGCLPVCIAAAKSAASSGLWTPPPLQSSAEARGSCLLIKAWSSQSLGPPPLGASRLSGYPTGAGGAPSHLPTLPQAHLLHNILTSQNIFEEGEPFKNTSQKFSAIIMGIYISLQEEM